MDASLGKLIADYLRACAACEGADVNVVSNLKTAASCVDQAFGLPMSEVDVPLAPGLAKITSAGKKALGVTSASLKKPAKDPVEDSALFKKFLANVESKGFFKDAEKGTAEYASRYAKVLSKFKSRIQKSSAAATPAAASASQPATSQADEEKAIALKNDGNAFLKQGKFEEAVAKYTAAIETSPTGPSTHIFYGNRAAALSHLERYEDAASDCSASIALKGNYVKAHSRLAHAQLMLKRYKEAVTSCNAALEIDPSNSAAKATLKIASQHVGAPRSDSINASAPAAAGAPAGTPAGMPAGMPDLGGLASMLGGMGGGGGAAGGNPMAGLGGLLNNPAMMQMAQNMMQDPAMMQMAQNMMSDPNAMANAMAQMQQNPEMMQQMMGALGGMGGNGAGGAQ